MIVLGSYRAARSGIMTGVLLAVARVSGETAPLLFTALSNQFMSWNMNAPLANLPVVIFQFAASPFKDWNTLAWAKPRSRSTISISSTAGSTLCAQ